jgi:U3 small nucleolar RNA-associated protein 10
MLEIALRAIESHPKSKLVKSSQTIFGFLQDAFDLRSNETQCDDAELDRLEDLLNDVVISLTLKLNDTVFRPFFTHMADWVSVKGKKAADLKLTRSITFYKFLAAFFDKFKVCSPSLISESQLMVTVHCHELRELHCRACSADAI